LQQRAAVGIHGVGTVRAEGVSPRSAEQDESADREEVSKARGERLARH